MSRSGYGDYGNVALWREAVRCAINGKRGQAFLRELAAAMDAMPDKKLITEELVADDGACCTLGVVCKARGIAAKKLDEYDPENVGNALGIARAMAAEVAYENDEHHKPETPEERWVRMRKWVADNLHTAEARGL
jgi:hypothetical protein